jgi:peptide-methionine (R)-S-oxide reductase
MPDDDLKSCLSPEQYHITQEKGTERAFTGVLDCHDDGVYRVVCNHPLFFRDEVRVGQRMAELLRAADATAVRTVDDTSYNMRRTEVMCENCGAHLDTYSTTAESTGMRYCINSAALTSTRSRALTNSHDGAPAAPLSASPSWRLQPHVSDEPCRRNPGGARISHRCDWKATPAWPTRSRKGRCIGPFS